MQTGLTVGDGAITGTLKYLSSGQLVTDWGAGNFMALKFTAPENATSVLVGLQPSVSSGLAELVGDPDQNGVFKVTNKDTQIFIIKTTVGNITSTQTFDLSGLTVQSE